MGSKKVKKSWNETATTTPNLAPYAQGPVESLFSKTGSLMDSDWSPYTAPNSILNNVFANTNNLTPGNSWLQQGAEWTQNALGNPYASRLSTTGGAPQVATRTLNNLQLGDASLAYAPAMERATLGDPTKVDLSGALSGFKAKEAEMGLQAFGGAATGGRASTYMNDYLYPGIENVVKTTLNDFDIDAGKQTAAYASDAAKRGAFGGSRVALGETALMGELSRARAATDANIREQNWRNAIAAGAGDAGNETNASIATAANTTQASVANANNDSDRLMFNAGEANKFGLLGMEGSIAAARDNAKYAADYGLARFGEDGLNNRTQYTTQADLNKTNAASMNDFSLAQNEQNNLNNRLAFTEGGVNDRFNADMGLRFGDQRLAQAAQLGDIGGLLNSEARATAGAQMDIGQVLQQIMQDETMAPAEKLALYNSLMTGGGLLGTTTGQTIKSDGTSTQKSSGGFVGDLVLALAANAAKIGSMGGGG